MDNSVKVDVVGGELLATPLQWAARYWNKLLNHREGHLQVVLLLHEYGANIHFIDSQGYNSLHLAVHGKKPDMLLLLLALGGNIDSKDSFGRTPLMWACYAGDNDDLVLVLLEWGADLNIRDVTGYTALHWAVVSSHFHHGKLLVEAGADQEIVDDKSKTAKDWAIERKWDRQYDKMIVSTISRWFTKYQADWIMYLIPFVVLPIYFYTFGNYSALFSIPFFFITAFLITQFIERILTNMDSMQLMNSPVMASVLQSTILWSFLTWIYIIPCKSVYFLKIRYIILTFLAYSSVNNVCAVLL